MSAPVFRLYDTMTREVRPLETSEPGHLRFYTCGPTVYSYAHIGNFRSFLTADLIVRTARALGWRVTWVVNITDVGHMTEDDVADAGGEDRMEKALRSKEGEAFPNVWALADYYTQAFLTDWKRLNLTEPYVRPRATQHVREQILMIEELVRRGHAYETPTGVYFSVDSDPDYGRLSGNTRARLKEAVRDVVLDENKRQQADFALWKKDEKHLMQWYSPWGWGFPGWHIECSAMARAYLGDTIDLHSGGEDNMFPHHECEIAQSECLTDKTFARHWLHVRFLQVEGEKMAKRTGNFLTVRDLVEEHGVDPIALRFALISTPYGKPFNFTLQLIRDASRHVDRFRACRSLAAEARSEGDDRLASELERLYAEVLSAMADNLNTSIALAKALEGASAIFRHGASMSAASAATALRFLDRIEELLGITGKAQEQRSSAEVSERISALIALRADAKRAKDYARADAIRSELEALGVELRDSPDGTTWRWRSR